MDENSRLIIKGLPNKITGKRLRDLFSSHGTITDCQLKYRPDGKFRKFAFIGFVNDSEAASAKEYYNNTFIDTSKIQVDFCRKIGDINEKSKPKKLPADQASGSAGQSLVLEISGFARGTKKKALMQFFAPIKPKRIHLTRGDESESGSALIFLTKRSEVQEIRSKSGKFFGGCKITVKNVAADDERIRRKEENGKDRGMDASKVQRPEECVEKISETGRLFVRNLPYVCTVEEIEELFKTYGPLADVKLPMSVVLGSIDDGAKKPKGIALVTFVFPEHALKAYSELDGSVYKGRMLHIIAGEEKLEEKEKKRQQTGDGSFKSKKAAQLKSQASQSHNWNALFLSPNAVADVLTERLDTEKSKLLNTEQAGANLGVRMALGESSLVQETRTFLLQHGVSLDSFSRPNSARSKTVILVKNLPAKSTADELREKFQKFGNVARLVLPPSGISALVEFLDEQEAKKAFTSLAYSRFKAGPLYLEWAPGDVFMSTSTTDQDAESHEAAQEEMATEKEEKEGKNRNEEEKERNKDEKERNKEEKERNKEEKEHHLPKDEEGTTLFVKNLNFETDDDILREHFSKIGPLVYANVAKKRTPSKDNPGLLSMGFGFVQFRTQSDAKKALKEMQGRELDGFALQLKLSDRQLPSDSGGRKRRRSSSSGNEDKSKSETKILVRNIPFQARQREMESLFKTFGDLRFVRLPKKTGSDGHRGFGFVDFVSKSDARKAFDALCHSTHLYGRRLVLEWASTMDDTVEELQRKVATQVTAVSGRRRHLKKNRIDLDNEEQ